MNIKIDFNDDGKSRHRERCVQFCHVVYKFCGSFCRGLQPIYEAGENTVVTENINSNEYLNIKNNDLNNDDTSSGIIITNNTNQPKESYSPCLKVIEKFQEIVMDSAVRVIQAAFKRFRERKRFLRIKKAVMVIQRNLRKWIQARHPCLRPAEFDRQSSDSAKSDEYRETDDRITDDNVLDGEDNNHMVESEQLTECNKTNNLDETQETICTSNSEECELKSSECREKNANDGMETCNINTTEQQNHTKIVNNCNNNNEETCKAEVCDDEIPTTATLQTLEVQLKNDDNVINENVQSNDQDVTVDCELHSQQSVQSTELQEINECYGEQEQCDEEIILESLQSDDEIQNTSNVEDLTESDHDNFNDDINKIKIRNTTPQE